MQPPCRPQKCSFGVCMAAVESRPIGRRACPLSFHLAKQDHIKCLGTRVPEEGTSQGTTETGQCLAMHLQLLNRNTHSTSPEKTRWGPGSAPESEWELKLVTYPLPPPTQTCEDPAPHQQLPSWGTQGWLSRVMLHSQEVCELPPTAFLPPQQ